MIIATVLGLLALFSFVSILLSGDDELTEADPRDQLPCGRASACADRTAERRLARARPGSAGPTIA